MEKNRIRGQQNEPQPRKGKDETQRTSSPTQRTGKNQNLQTDRHHGEDQDRNDVQTSRRGKTGRNEESSMGTP